MTVPTPTAVTPPTFAMSVSEIQTVALDATAYLTEGESVLGATVTVTRLSDGRVVTLSDNPQVEGNQVVQILRGAELDAGSVYQLRVTFTATPSTNVWTMDLVVTATA